jgi:peroxiredoxin
MAKLLGMLLIATTCLGGGHAAALEIGGNVGPVNLTALSGDRIVMNNYGERPATVVLFLSGRCEATERTIADVNRSFEKLRHRGVLFVGVCSNPEESGQELRTFSQRRGMIFPLYRDSEGEVARQFDARMTPELYLLDRQGVLKFHGGVQDAAARKAYEAAMSSVLRKQPPEVTTVAAEGTPLDRPGPKREVDDHYGEVSFSSELVFNRVAGAAAHHCSTICEAGNKDLLCLWYGGTYESADDQTLFLARKKPGDRNWGTPQPLIQNTAQPPGNGVIFRDASDRVWIVWCRMEGTRPMGRGEGWGRCRLFERTSTDHGATWSEDRPVIGETVWCVPRNPPVALKDGTLLLPVEGSWQGAEGSHFLTLAPGATAWQRAGFTSGGSQPAVVQRHDGSLLALLRHSRNIRQTESRDGGQTWTKAEATALKNPDAGITMTRLANGHLVLVYNDSQTSRTPLSITRSVDEGKTWDKPLDLESTPGECSYPCIIQAADGNLHITYTFRRYAIKHVELNEDWLVRWERSD